MSKYRLILVDGSSYLFRAYYALPPLTNSRDEPTGAIVGVVTMLQRLINAHRPELMAVIFDPKGETFRNDLYADYKANRPPTPEDLSRQIPPLFEIIEAMGLALIVIDRVEADDVIGTLARQASSLEVDTLIATGDKDLAQLVDRHVTLIDTMTDTLLDIDGVKGKFGVLPEQIIDYLALIGDKVDNIPGVHKCGPKTAVKWLAEQGDLETVIANADKIKGKVGEYLREALHQLPRFKELITIKTDVALELGPMELKPKPTDIPRLRELYRRLESRRLLAGLDQLGANHDGDPEAETEQARRPEYQTILEGAEFDDWLERLQQAELFAFDTETTSLDYLRAELVGLSFSCEPYHAAYVPLAHTAPGSPDQLDRDRVLAKLKPLLEDSTRIKVGQNLKYDMGVLARYGIEMRGIGFDTMLESYVLNSTGRHDMDSLAERFLKIKTIHFEAIAGKGAKQLTFDQVPIEQASPYAAEDADVTLRLHRHLWSMLKTDSPLDDVLKDLEVPLIPVLSRMERAGVKIDGARLRHHSQELSARLTRLEEQAYAIAGRKFNLGSPKQIGQIFFIELELPVVSKTKGKAPSTSEAVLEELANQGHDLPRVILDHRRLAKLKSTYTDKLPEQCDVDGRVHTNYHQAVTTTGRLSSSDPNLQNIPIRTEEGRRIRQAFIPEAGFRMLAADYSQIELRIMAHLSKDQGLTRAFERGLDIHKATAAEVFAGGAIDAVTALQRRSAKAINFGLIYGMSAVGLGKQLGIERGAAQEYIDRYFNRYPGVKDYMRRTRTSAYDNGYVETLFGRRLYVNEIRSRNWQRRSGAERAAINAPMQGTAADIIKRAMLAIDAWLQTEWPGPVLDAPVRMLMQVHDELVFEVRDDLIEPATEQIRVHMQQAADLEVPLLVDIGTGTNWHEAH